MNLYLISQDFNSGYDTYDSAVVCAKTEDEARMIHPSGKPRGKCSSDTWVGLDQLDKVSVTLIGKTKQGSKKGVVLASFNAG